MAAAVASIGSMGGTVAALEVVTIIVQVPARLHPAEIQGMAVIDISTADMTSGMVGIDRGPLGAMADTTKTLTAAEVQALTEDLTSLN